MPLGCRVVRGPDWKWGDQDGGEGGVGTIVNLQTFSDGRPLPSSKAVLVCWDIGRQADYRTGLNGCYDLRVFDSSSAGVVFTSFTCDGCMHSGITGIRWHCADCHDFDLCNICYSNDVHDKDHNFVRYDISNDKTNGTNVGKRSEALNSKIRSRGIFPGAIVKRGRDWTLDNDVGVEPGKVVGLTAWQGTPRSAVIVNWGNNEEKSHRVGYEGKMDLTLVKAANGPWYYRDHLPVVSSAKVARLASTGGKELRVGDLVKTELDVETLKLMAEGHGGWATGMEKAVGRVGRVAQIDEDGDVHVQYKDVKWVFHPEALCKITELRVGDKVRVIDDKEQVIALQEGHGGWNNEMQKALGKIGKVIRVDEDGDMVVTIGNSFWIFNPSALILESKEEERVPVEDTPPNDNGLELLLHQMIEGLLSNSSKTPVSAQMLHLATTVGDLENVKRILKNDKTLINQKFANNKTPLHVACHQGKSEIVSYLLENGADKEIRDEDGYTALHHAAYGDKSGVCVVLMLSANANVNANDLDRTKVTPLHLAVQRGNEQPVAALVQSKHCDVNCQDVLGDTPLHEAILRGHDNIFSILFKVQNLDPSICNANGFNLLHLACLKNSQHAAKLLIEKFPGLIDIPKEDGFAALHITALNNHHEIARLLLLSGHCNINLHNQEGMTALSLSVTQTYTEMIELLIDHGVDINAENNEGDTPLHVAVMKHCIADIGLDSEPLDSNEPEGRSNTEKAIALFLVVRGAKVDYRNHQGKTPLDLCIDKDLGEKLKHYSVQREVLKAGTPLSYSSPNNVKVLSQPLSEKKTIPSAGLANAAKMPDKPKSVPSSSSAPGTIVQGTETVLRPVDSRSTAPNTVKDPQPLPVASPIPSARLADVTKMSHETKPSPLLPGVPPSIVSRPLNSRNGAPSTVQVSSQPQPETSHIPSAGLANSMKKLHETKLLPPSPASASSPIDSRPVDSRNVVQSTVQVLSQPLPSASPIPSAGLDDATKKPLETKLLSPSSASAAPATVSRSPDSRNMAALSASTSTAEATSGDNVPIALSNLPLRDGVCASNVASGSAEPERKDPNLDMASEIKTSSDKKTKLMESQNPNVQDETCHYCLGEIAVVTFKPCNHRVVCQGCSVRAKVCLQCHTEISDKILPTGEAPYVSLRDIKKDYHRLQKKLDEMERLALCQICMDRPSNTVFRPCGHKSCKECSARLRECHICKRKIEERFISYA